MCHTAWRDRVQAGLELTFNAGVIMLDAAKREATFYIMNTSRNRNKWGVTAKALQEGAPTIKGKAIGSGKGYKTDGHYPDGQNIDLGKFTSWDVPSSYMTATANITDDTAWSKLRAGEWGPISVVVTPFAVHCSKCGEDIAAEFFEHEHVAKNQAYVVVDSFRFDRVDFVDNPAYPQAGVLDVEASSVDRSTIITLIAGVYQDSHSKLEGVGTVPQTNGPKKVRKNLMTPEELQAELDKKEQEIEELKAEAAKVKDLEAKVVELTASVSDDDNDDKDDPKYKDLTERLDRYEAEVHDSLVVACAEARFKAGLATDLEEEKERLKAFSDVYLRTLKGDAEEFEKKVKAATPKRAPKAHYDEEDELTGIDAAFKAVKDRIFPEPIHKSLLAQVGGVTE